jgi:hypothetical protein
VPEGLCCSFALFQLSQPPLQQQHEPCKPLRTLARQPALVPYAATLLVPVSNPACLCLLPLLLPLFPSLQQRRNAPSPDFATGLASRSIQGDISTTSADRIRTDVNQASPPGTQMHPAAAPADTTADQAPSPGTQVSPAAAAAAGPQMAQASPPGILTPQSTSVTTAGTLAALCPCPPAAPAAAPSGPAEERSRVAEMRARIEARTASQLQPSRCAQACQSLGSLCL